MGRAFALCWRCSAILATLAVLTVAMAWMSLAWLMAPAVWLMALGLGAWDAWRSWFAAAGTSNRNRALFGAITGAGLFGLAGTLDAMIGG